MHKKNLRKATSLSRQSGGGLRQNQRQRKDFLTGDTVLTEIDEAATVHLSSGGNDISPSTLLAPSVYQMNQQPRYFPLNNEASFSA